jgi:hypothetical protein
VRVTAGVTPAGTPNPATTIGGRAFICAASTFSFSESGPDRATSRRTPFLREGVHCLRIPISKSKYARDFRGVKVFDCSGGADIAGDTLQKFVIGLLGIAAVAVACTPEDEQTEQQRICASRLYPNYNSKILDQCMNVCKSCRGGNTVTCSTSCKLKGAS